MGEEVTFVGADVTDVGFGVAVGALVGDVVVKVGPVVGDHESPCLVGPRVVGCTGDLVGAFVGRYVGIVDGVSVGRVGEVVGDQEAPVAVGPKEGEDVTLVGVNVGAVVSADGDFVGVFVGLV